VVMKSYKKLTKEERIRLFRMRRLGYSAHATARALCRSHSTILRELKRNASAIEPHADYYTHAQRAQELAHKRRSTASRRKMRLKCGAIRWSVEFHLVQAHWSPATIAGRLSLQGLKISAEAIYQYINLEKPELKGSLLIAGKSRRRRRSGMRQRIRLLPAAPKRSIEALPTAAKERQELGHFELDALLGKRGGPAFQVKVDRCARKLFIDRVESLESESYADKLIWRLQRDVPRGVLKTILNDNGTEHAAHQRVDATLGVRSHFCHPYCASERGTVENRNKALRRFLTKGGDFSGLNQDFIEWVEDYFNNLPMAVLGFKTPNEVWKEKLVA
jgi:IS30 family transposase